MDNPNTIGEVKKLSEHEDMLSLIKPVETNAKN